MAVVPYGSITNTYAHYVCTDEDGTWYEPRNWIEEWHHFCNCPCYFNMETGEMVWTICTTGAEVRQGTSSWFLPASIATPDLMICDLKASGADQLWNWEEHWSERCNNTVYLKTDTKDMVFAMDDPGPPSLEEVALEVFRDAGADYSDDDSERCTDDEGTARALEPLEPDYQNLAIEVHRATITKCADNRLRACVGDDERMGSIEVRDATNVKRADGDFHACARDDESVGSLEPEAEPDLRCMPDDSRIIDAKLTAKTLRANEAKASTERAEIGAHGLAKVAREAKKRARKVDHDSSAKQDLLPLPGSIDGQGPEELLAPVPSLPAVAYMHRDDAFAVPTFRSSEASERRSPQTVGCWAAYGLTKIIKDLAKGRRDQGLVAPAKQLKLEDACESLFPAPRGQAELQEPEPHTSCADSPGVESGAATLGHWTSYADQWEEVLSGIPVGEQHAGILLRVGAFVAAQPLHPLPDHLLAVACMLAQAAAAALPTPALATSAAGASATGVATPVVEETVEASSPVSSRFCSQCRKYGNDGAAGDDDYAGHWFCSTCWHRWVGPVEAAVILRKARLAGKAREAAPTTPSKPGWTAHAQVAPSATTPEVKTLWPLTPSTTSKQAGPSVSVASPDSNVVSEASSPESAVVQDDGLGQEVAAPEEEQDPFQVPRLPRLNTRPLGQAEAKDYDQIRGAGDQLARMLSDRLVRQGEVKVTSAGVSAKASKGERWSIGAAELGA